MTLLNSIPIGIGRLLRKPATTSASRASNIYTTNLTPLRNAAARRHFSGFSFAGPRKLDEIMKTEMIEGKNKAEISDIWMSYHEEKERIYGTIVSGKQGKLILERAAKM
jgi:hypothetical protein